MLGVSFVLMCNVSARCSVGCFRSVCAQASGAWSCTVGYFRLGVGLPCVVTDDAARDIAVSRYMSVKGCVTRISSTNVSLCGLCSNLSKSVEVPACGSGEAESECADSRDSCTELRCGRPVRRKVMLGIRRTCDDTVCATESECVVDSAASSPLSHHPNAFGLSKITTDC